ncbi:MAG TPA: hypothetical protein VI603_10075 [Saprospiraceae bacterium]|nr:hypothetical protein [Saprospiraceae bacterium]
MKLTFTIIVLLLLAVHAISQISGEQLEGTVSYKNTQNVYVKFNNTSQIVSGDTLFVLREGNLIPALIVQHTSSLSVVGTPIADIQLKVADKIIFRAKAIEEIQPKTVETQQDKLPAPAEVPAVPEPESESGHEVITEVPAWHESIRGRLSASFYSNVLNTTVNDVQRMRYTFSMQAGHLGDSRFSAETYVSFRHQLDDWNAEKVEMSKALRVYSLALKYDAGTRTSFTIGRKVNTHISNVGAIDGLQAEHTSGKLTYGGFAGTRPDHVNYGFNRDLLQFGAFVALRRESKHGLMQTSLAMVEQRNASMTDRRFTYFQHSSTFIKNISVFGSFEVDLYERPDSVARNAFNLTSMYFSLQYRPSRKWTFFGSYDARKNVIYYETYRNFIDELIEQETRQGLRFRINYRPMKYVTIGSSVGYRFQKDQGSNSMNMNHYITHSRVPWIKASVTASAILLENDYLHGFIYGARMSRDVIKQKVFGELEYRKVHYAYGDSGFELQQHIFGLNLSWRIRKKLSLAMDYEGIFEKEKSNNRVHVNIAQRF